MFKDKQFNKAFLISLSWHIFLLFFVTIIVLPANFKLARTSTVSFLGPILGKTAFEMMVDQQPRLKGTSFTQPFYSNSGVIAPAAGAADRLRFDKVFGPVKKAGGAGTKELFGNSKIVPSFKQVESAPAVENKAMLQDNSGLSIKGPLAGREIIFRPAPPALQRRVEAADQDSFGIELRLTVLPDGAVSEASLLASSGYPDIDLEAINYVKTFKFLPVTPGEAGSKSAAQTGTLRLDLKSR